jgi:hypothetical protein
VDISIEERATHEMKTSFRNWIPARYAPAPMGYYVVTDSVLHAYRIGVWRKMIQKYALFNPHAKFVFRYSDENGWHEELFEPTDISYKKFSPGDPTSPWWYTVDDLNGNFDYSRKTLLLLG